MRGAKKKKKKKKKRKKSTAGSSLSVDGCVLVKRPFETVFHTIWDRLPEKEERTGG